METKTEKGSEQPQAAADGKEKMLYEEMLGFLRSRTEDVPQVITAMWQGLFVSYRACAVVMKDEKTVLEMFDEMQHNVHDMLEESIYGRKKRTETALKHDLKTN
ncbi:MAG: hypothetical protein ACI4TW_08510 [Prevotella sp.]